MRSTTGGRLFSGGADATVRVWELNQDAIIPDLLRQRGWISPRRKEIATLHGHEAPVRRVAVTPGGQIVSASDDGTVKLWGAEDEEIPILAGHYTSVYAVTFSRDGRYLISAGGGNDDSIIVWDVERCVPVAREYLRFAEGVHDLAYGMSRGQPIIAGATGGNPTPGRVVLWDLRDPAHPTRLCALTPQDDTKHRFAAVAISLDGKRLAAGERGGGIYVWDLSERDSPEFQGILTGHIPGMSSLVFLDEEGHWLVSANTPTDDDQHELKPLRIWDIDSRTESSAKQVGAIRDLAFRPQSDWLATAGDDGIVRLWSVAWNGGVPSLELKNRLEGHTGPVLSVAFHPTEPRVASGSDDRTIKIWDLDTFVEVATLRGHAGSVSGLAFDPTGERLASASTGFEGTDNVVRLWETEIALDLRERRAVIKRAKDEVRELFQGPHNSLDDARYAISNDLRLPEDVRTEANRLFLDLLPHPNWLSTRAWNMATNAARSRREYLGALSFAEAAVEMAGEHVYALNALGAAQYRLALYEEALETFERARDVDWIPEAGEWAFMAMVYFRNGEHDKAAKALETARELVESTDGHGDPEAVSLYEEAEALIVEKVGD